MDIHFEIGSQKYLDDCEEVLLNSEMGRTYFSGEGSARRAILEGLDQGTLLIARHNDVCVGFVYYMPKGAFHSFPYIHLLSVKEGYRGKGVGKQIMDFLDETVFLNANKTFLVVADFNADAKRFYERNGYKQVGELPNLYREGITEYLMMKEKEAII